MRNPGINIQNELQDLILADKYSQAISLLYKQQSESWPLLKKGIESLSSVELKKYFFDGYEIFVQFNPGRIKSTAAHVSPEAVKKRECFLCTKNLFQEQEGILYKEKYSILCNPYPIFSGHLTIRNIRHQPQRIKKAFPYMLEISGSIPDYCLIYNGPEAGASAPDHLHFQACKKESLPVNLDYEGLKNEFGEEITSNEVKSYAIDDGIRKMFSFESESSKALIHTFNNVYSSYTLISKSHVEPMMNIVASYEAETGWRVIIFFRKKHRPDAYFKEGDENILVSPATIDMGGVLITPLEKDFRKINKETAAQILREVSMGKEEFDYLKTRLHE